MKKLFEKGRQALRRGLGARAEGKMKEAVEAYAEALDLFERSGQVGAAIVALNNMGAAIQTAGDMNRAADLYREALARAESIDDTAREALSCGNLGALHLDSGDLVRAEILIQRALELYNRLGAASGRANQLGNLGLIACARGDMETAREHMAEATGAFLAAGNLLGAGRTMLSFGEFARQQGDRDRANDAFARAMDILTRAGDKAGCANALRGLGQVALRGGQLDEARTFIERGMALHRDMEDRRGESAAMIDLANIHHQTGDIRAALALQQEAAAIAEKAGVREGFASASLAVASSHLDLGELDACQIAIDKALLLFEALEAERGIASALGTRARLALVRGRSSQALADLDRGLTIALKGGFVPLEAALKGISANAAEQSGQPQRARALLDEAIALYDTANAPAGAHSGKLAHLELDTWAHLTSTDLDEALREPRLAAARAFFESSGDRAGLLGLRRLETTIRRCLGDYQGAAEDFKEIAEGLEALDRLPDTLTARTAHFEALLRQGASPPPAALEALAAQAQDHGMATRALRCGLLAAEAHIQAGELQAAEATLDKWSTLLAPISETWYSGETLRLDTKARLHHARGETDEAAATAARAIARYETSQDEVGASELRAALQLPCSPIDSD